MHMRRAGIVVIFGLLLAFSAKIGYSQLSEWGKKSGGSPPVITHWFAAEQLHPGDTWRIYVAAKDPDGDMRQFVAVLDQVGYGSYPASYRRIKKKNGGELKGYLVVYSTTGMGLRMAEWTQLKLTLSIRDRGRNSSNKVVLPLVLSLGAKQQPPSPPFDSGGLDKLGALWFDLVDPSRDGDGIGGEIVPER
jgi:hypothetical protein